MKKAINVLTSIFFCFPFFSFATVLPGVDVFFNDNHHQSLREKKVGLVTNHTGVNKTLVPTTELFNNSSLGLKLKALFSPEHGLDGSAYAFEKIKNSKDKKGIPIFSLHGSTKRPTKEMLKDIDVLIYDIQDIGIRAYTYISTLFYVMEEAASHKIPVIVLDRPNPINGITVDGPMLDDSWRSFLGYINVPYCHGMTVGELALYFNKEYKIGCNLTVIPMKGWRRSMKYSDTGLRWIPPSPHVPESDTPYYQASTGILGEIEIANIGIGYTLPFKVVGAEWIDAEKFSTELNKLKLPGVKFAPFHYRPFYGSYKNKDCHGTLIIIENPSTYKPLSVQFAILGILKSLYPKSFKACLSKLSKTKKSVFCKVTGGNHIFSLLENEKYVTYKLIDLHSKERKNFEEVRKKYLLPEYPE